MSDKYQRFSDAYGPRFRASRRATACLALAASIAIAGCGGDTVPPTQKGSAEQAPASWLTYHSAGGARGLLWDRQTGCQYIVLHSRTGVPEGVSIHPRLTREGNIYCTEQQPKDASHD